MVLIAAGPPKRLARFLLVGAASLVLVVCAFQGLWFVFGATRPGAEPVSGTADRKTLFDCVAQEVRDRVPPGATIHIAQDQPVDPDLWSQRLVEMSFSYATIVDDPRDAAFDVGVQAVAPPSGCRGIEVTVVPRS
jgi:hypothetical protein